MTRWAPLLGGIGAIGVVAVLATGPVQAGDELALQPGGGFSYSLGEGLSAGIAVDWDGGGFDAGDAVAVGPYLGWQPVPELTIDVSVGVAMLDQAMARGSAFDRQADPRSVMRAGVEAGYTVGLGDAYGFRSYVRIEGEWEPAWQGSQALLGADLRPERAGARVAAGFDVIRGSSFAGNVEASLDGYGSGDRSGAALLGTLRFSF